MQRILATLVATGALAACSTSAKLSQMDFNQVGQQPTGVLLAACEETWKNPDPFVVEHLRKRDDIRVMDARRCPSLLPEFVWRRQIRQEYVPAIRRGEVRPGMNEAEMKVARGEPLRSVERGGQVEHVYGTYGPYVYTENGVVVSVSN